jgi:pimeloyl-ACP methyl ester carboxylesterase
LRGVQARRPSLYDLIDKMKTITAPALVMTGDEDWPCLEPGILMKQTIPTAALLVMPNAGHGINTEDPGAFNAHLADFFHTVDLGKWPARDPRALVASILGNL